MPQKILIIQNKFLGDVLVASMLAASLKSIDKSFVIDFFCYSNALPLLENNPHINEVIHCNEVELKKISILIMYLLKIREKKYDIVLDPYAKIQSQLLTLFSGAKKTASYNTGYKRLIYSDVIPLSKNKISTSCNAVEDKLGLVKVLFPNYTIKEVPYKIYTTSEEKKHGFELLKNIPSINLNFPLIMIGIQGSNELKSYPYEFMTKLIQSILNSYNNNVTILFNYLPNQSDIAKKIYSFLDYPANIYPHLIGKNLTDMLCALSYCKVVIGCEGGLIHMAKAMNIPTFTIYSSLIFRESWGVFENLKQNESVHLIDFRPDLYNTTNLDSNKLKSEFLPEYIIPKLSSFLTKFL